MLILLLSFFLAACQESLYSGLTEVEVNQMRQVLSAQEIESEKRLADDGKHELMVDRSDVGRALRALELAGLPKHKFSSTMDVLKSDALVASPAEDRARLAYALSQELSSTISGIDGVISARVHLVLPDRASLGAARTTTASASVLVKYKQGYNMQAVNLSIRQLVARSVDGLAPEKVSVVLLPSEQSVDTKTSMVNATKTSSNTAGRSTWITVGAFFGLVVGLIAGQLLPQQLGGALARFGDLKKFGVSRWLALKSESRKH